MFRGASALLLIIYLLMSTIRSTQSGVSCICYCCSGSSTCMWTNVGSVSVSSCSDCTQAACSRGYSSCPTSSSSGTTASLCNSAQKLSSSDLLMITLTSMASVLVVNGAFQYWTEADISSLYRTFQISRHTCIISIVEKVFFWWVYIQHVKSKQILL